jgi:hypothetical protein
VSITGLEVKSLFYYPLFMYHAIPSFRQAQISNGNIFAETRQVRGIDHTLTVWESRKDMLEYMRKGAHAEAMRTTRKVAKYAKIYGYESKTIPTWEDALKLWEENGRVVAGEPTEADKARIQRSRDLRKQLVVS